MFRSEKEFKVSFGSVKTIPWHDHWWQRAPVARILVQGLQTNGANNGRGRHAITGLYYVMVPSNGLFSAIIIILWPSNGKKLAV